LSVTCFHVELEQFLAWFRDAPVCQRQLGILVYTSRCKKATPTYTVVLTAVAAADRPIDMSLQIIPQRDISVLNSACYGGGFSSVWLKLRTLSFSLE